MTGLRGANPHRGFWMASGIVFFLIGVASTIALPDNFVLGIVFLGLGILFVSLSSGRRHAEGDDAAPTDPAKGD